MTDPNTRPWAARRLADALARVPALQDGVLASGPDFDAWVRGVKRALAAGLGDDHAFAREFEALTTVHRAAVGRLGQPGSFEAVEHRTPPQDVLRAAEPLLRDAIDVLGGAPAPAAPAASPAVAGSAGAGASGAPTPAAPTAAAPTALVSYSWTDDDHVAWVHHEFAARLRTQGGVHVRLDEWDVGPGESLTAFMERGVRDSDFVLAVCDPAYKAKTDDRTGGVGYEARLLTGEAMRAAREGKVIPVLRGDRSVSVPTWLDGVKDVDLRGHPGGARYEAGFRRLVHALHGFDVGGPPVGPRPAPPPPRTYQPAAPGGPAAAPSAPPPAQQPPPSAELRHQAHQVRARLTILPADTLPLAHHGTPWTPGEAAHLVGLATGQRPYEGFAERAHGALTALAAITDRLANIPPGDPRPTAASAPHQFAEYQSLYAEAYRWLDAIIDGRARPSDPRWGPFAGGAAGATP